MRGIKKLSNVCSLSFMALSVFQSVAEFDNSKEALWIIPSHEASEYLVLLIRLKIEI